MSQMPKNFGVAGGEAEKGDRGTVNGTSISKRVPCSIRVLRGGRGPRDPIAVGSRCCLPAGVVSGLIQAEDSSRSWIESRERNGEGYLVTTASCPSSTAEDRIRGELARDEHRGRSRHQRLRFGAVAYPHPRVTCALDPSCQVWQAVHTPYELVAYSKLSTILIEELR